jgi:hypothetical protein
MVGDIRELRRQHPDNFTNIPCGGYSSGGDVGGGDKGLLLLKQLYGQNTQRWGQESGRKNMRDGENRWICDLLGTSKYYRVILYSGWSSFESR